MKRQPKIETYKAKDGWRWRLKASNGAIVAESGEAFTRRPKPQNVALYLLDLLASSRLAVTP